MKRWYVIYTHASCEEKVLVNLKHQGFEAYLPRYRKTRRHARKVETVLRPMFPRYLFVALDLERDQWRSINGTFGAVAIFCRGEKPVAVPQGIVESIIAREDERGAVDLTPPGLKRGDKVRIINGAFSDNTALIDEISDDQRVILLLDLMGRKVRVTVPTESLAIAS